MSLTIFGMVQVVISIWVLLRGSLNQMFALFIMMSLFGASAAVLLPAIGNSSIPPVQLALGFLVLRVIMPGSAYADAVPRALRQNFLLVLFVIYGIATAIAAPRIFAGQMNVVPLMPGELRHLYDTSVLRPTPQNLTTSIYLLGSLLAAICSAVVCRFRGGADTLVKSAVVISWCHALTGIIGLIVHGTPAEIIFSTLKNGTAAILEHEYAGFVRITGLFSEASTFAGFGVSWLIFNCECWYRSIRPKATGTAALVLGAVLFFSTSSTAYLGLASYAAFFILRLVVFPGAAPTKRLWQAGLTMLFAMVILALALLLDPRIVREVEDMISYMTLDKQSSDSGRQRLFWAMQGWDAFLTSKGLGIGPGSFRSSSLFMAILGSMGVIGIVTFIGYVWHMWRPDRRSTWGETDDPGLNVGGAAASAALIALVPAAMTAPSPVPGIIFAVLAAAGITLRNVETSNTSIGARKSNDLLMQS